MKLETKRLILREWRKGDEKDLIKNISNLKVSRFLADVPYPYTKKDADWWINHCKERIKENPRKDYYLAIELKEQKKAIGGIGIDHVDKFQGTAEIGYWLGENYWRKGIMSGAASKVLDFAFKKLKLRRIYTPIFIENKGSNALIRKLRFKHEGVLRKHGKAKSTGKVHDANIYGLLKEEWK